jgi:hypothetical protein
VTVPWWKQESEQGRVAAQGRKEDRASARVSAPNF